jgi:hypothetical protein
LGGLAARGALLFHKYRHRTDLAGNDLRVSASRLSADVTDVFTDTGFPQSGQSVRALKAGLTASYYKFTSEPQSWSQAAWRPSPC